VIFITVFKAEPIKPGGNEGAVIDFDVPARLLVTGDYQIELSRGNDGAKEIVASYYFRVK